METAFYCRQRGLKWVCCVQLGLALRGGGVDPEGPRRQPSACLSSLALVGAAVYMLRSRFLLREARRPHMLYAVSYIYPGKPAWRSGWPC